MKNEWSQRKNLSLVAKQRPKPREEPAPRKRPKVQEDRWKNKVEAPKPKRKKSSSPDTTRKGIRIKTGASAPVRVKISRLPSNFER